MSDTIDRLILEVAKLPTVSKKNAEKIVFHLLEEANEISKNLINSIIDMKKTIKTCRLCGNYTEQLDCKICLNEKRDKKTLCIVKKQKDILSIERSKSYSGMYHVLMINHDASKGFNIENLSIELLKKKLKDNRFDEIILALDADLDNETVIIYLKDLLAKYDSKISTIARGIPMGGKIEQSDLETIYHSIKNRFRKI